MDSNFLTGVFLPLTLFIIMLGMGLGLTLNDFKRIFITPKAVILGLTGQLIILPVLGLSLAIIFRLTPEFAVGLMILTASPGGPISNIVTYLARGNVALSITLTAISSLITVFTIPLVVNLAMLIFMGEGYRSRLGRLINSYSKLEFHYTPKHASWLNQVEIELSVLSRQCLERRIPDLQTLCPTV